MGQFIVTVDRLNRRKSIPATLADKSNIAGVVLRGFQFEAAEITGIPSAAPGKWYSDRDGYFYWGGGLTPVLATTALATARAVNVVIGANAADAANVVNAAAALTPVFNQNWRAYAQWNTPAGNPIAGFKVSWVVPQPPAFNFQLIYLFPSLGDTSRILQPVMQFGQGQNGSITKSWGIASFYYPDTNSPSIKSNGLIPVDSGTVLTAQILRLPGGSAGSFTYTCEFLGFDDTKITVPDIVELPQAAIVLEATDISGRADYPGVNQTEMNILSLTGNSNPLPVQWTPSASPGSSGEVVSLSGNTIELLY